MWTSRLVSRYDFRNWSGASSATTLTASVTMDAAKTLTANYTKQYKLSLATNPAAVGVSNLSGLAAGGWYRRLDGVDHGGC